MDMPLNYFKRALANRQTQIGIFVGLADTMAAEVVGTAGFDWLIIDGEHGPNDLRSIIAQMQVLAGHDVHVTVRTVDQDPARIKQLLDGGAQTLMVPMVESAAEATALVRAMRYPPLGMRGVGTALARAARWNGVSDYFDHADREMCLLVQIESTQALTALDAILAVDGVDGVFIGPADLAASMGYLGRPDHPEVQTAIEQAIQKIAASGKAAGALATTTETAARYKSLGACFLQVGADTLILRNAAVSLAEQFKASTGSSAGAAY